MLTNIYVPLLDTLITGGLYSIDRDACLGWEPFPKFRFKNEVSVWDLDFG